MTGPPKLNEFTRWKRSLLGGLASAGIVGIALALMYGFNLFPFPFVSFMSIGIIISNFFFGDSNLWIFIVSIVFWFITGSAITHYSKENSMAIRLWIVLYFVSFALFIVFYFYLNY